MASSSERAVCVVTQTDTELRLSRRTPQAGRVNDVRVIAYPTPRDAFAHTLKGDANLNPRSGIEVAGVFSGAFLPCRSSHGTGRTTDAIAFNVALPRSERIQLARILESQRVRELAYDSGECAENSGTSDGGDGTLAAGPVLRVLSWGPFERLALPSGALSGVRGGEVSHLSPQNALALMKSHDFDLVAVRPLRWPPSAMPLVWRTGAPYNFAPGTRIQRSIGHWTRRLAGCRVRPARKTHPRRSCAPGSISPSPT